MERSSTIVIQFTSSNKIYIAVNSNWWIKYIGLHIGSIKDCCVVQLTNITYKSFNLAPNSTLIVFRLYIQIKTAVWTEVYLVRGEIHFRHTRISTPPLEYGKHNDRYTFQLTTHELFFFFCNLLAPINALNINFTCTLNVGNVERIHNKIDDAKMATL